MKVINVTITDHEIVSIKASPVPFLVRLKQLLADNGIKFLSDGKPSFISPTMDFAGKNIRYKYDSMTGTHHYRQEIEEDDASS